MTAQPDGVKSLTT